MKLKRWKSVLALSLASLVSVLVQPSLCYCWEPFRNPSFERAPKTEQVSISQVRVSWAGIVKKRECADHFLVKYWQRNSPQQFKMSDLVSRDVNHIDVNVTPKVPYHFQAVAREDKGPVGGIDWNRSPVAEFKTSSYNVDVKDDPLPPSEPNLGSLNGEDGVIQTFPSSPPIDSSLAIKCDPNIGDCPPPPTGVIFASLTIEVFAIIIVCSFIGTLIIVGIVYKLIYRKKSRYAEDDEESDAAAEAEREHDADEESVGLKSNKADFQETN